MSPSGDHSIPGGSDADPSDGDVEEVFDGLDVGAGGGGKILEATAAFGRSLPAWKRLVDDLDSGQTIERRREGCEGRRIGRKGKHEEGKIEGRKNRRKEREGRKDQKKGRKDKKKDKRMKRKG